MKKPSVIGLPINPKNKEDRRLLKALDRLGEKLGTRSRAELLRKLILREYFLFYPEDHPSSETAAPSKTSTGR